MFPLHRKHLPLKVQGTGTDPGLATLTWVPPTVTDLNGLEVTGYLVERYNSVTGGWDEIATPTESPYPDRGLTRGKIYYYRIASVNDHGAGEYFSPYRAATIPPAAPDAPQLTATATGPRSIELTWTIPADNGMDINGFEVQKWMDDPDTPAVDLAWRVLDVNLASTAVTSASSTQTFFADENLMPNTRYDYRIRATTGTNNSEYDQTYGMTHIGAPGRPEVTAAAEGENAIKLTWTAPAANGSPIDRYEVSMWDTSTKSWGWNGVADGVHTVSHRSQHSPTADLTPACRSSTACAPSTLPPTTTVALVCGRRLSPAGPPKPANNVNKTSTGLL